MNGCRALFIFALLSVGQEDEEHHGPGLTWHMLGSTGEAAQLLYALLSAGQEDEEHHGPCFAWHMLGSTEAIAQL
eukprot:1160438-Pelagomonas_calceolata.AAC.1